MGFIAVEKILKRDFQKLIIFSELIRVCLILRIFQFLCCNVDRKSYGF